MSDSFEEDKALANGHVCFGCMGRQAEIDRLRAELAVTKKVADLCDFAPEADRLDAENKALRAKNAKLRELLDDWLMAHDLPGDHCEYEQCVIRTRAAFSRPAAPKEET